MHCYHPPLCKRNAIMLMKRLCLKIINFCNVFDYCHYSGKLLSRSSSFNNEKLIFFIAGHCRIVVKACGMCTVAN